MDRFISDKRKFGKMETLKVAFRGERAYGTLDAHLRDKTFLQLSLRRSAMGADFAAVTVDPDIGAELYMSQHVTMVGQVVWAKIYHALKTKESTITGYAGDNHPAVWGIEAEVVDGVLRVKTAAGVIVKNISTADVYMFDPPSGILAFMYPYGDKPGLWRTLLLRPNDYAMYARDNIAPLSVMAPCFDYLRPARWRAKMIKDHRVFPLPTLQKDDEEKSVFENDSKCSLYLWAYGTRTVYHIPPRSFVDIGYLMHAPGEYHALFNTTSGWFQSDAVIRTPVDRSQEITKAVDFLETLPVDVLNIVLDYMEDSLLAAPRTVAITRYPLNRSSFDPP
jgi:hypothetical protein